MSSKNRRTYEAIVKAVRENDYEMIALLAQCIDMGDAAKQVLRNKGYGWTGLDLLKTCEMVPIAQGCSDDYPVIEVKNCEVGKINQVGGVSFPNLKK